MNPLLKEGLAIKARPTKMNQNCEIDASTAKGYICKADANGVSIYLERGYNRGWIQAVMTLETFAHNFEKDNRPDSGGHNISIHFSKRYPDDYK